MRSRRLSLSLLTVLALSAGIPKAANAKETQLPIAKVPIPDQPFMTKISGSLKAQILQRQAYLQAPSPETYKVLEIQGLTSRPVESLILDLRLDAYPAGELAARLEALGVRLYEETWIAPFGGHVTGQLFAEVPLERVYELAAIPEVRELRSGQKVHYPHNNLGALDMGADILWGNSFTGAGVRVGVLDSGLEEAHADIPTPVFKRDYSAWPVIDMGIGNTVTGHGTHVAGSVLGRGTASSGTYKGVAYGAELVFIKIGSDLTSGASFLAETNAIRACVDSFGCDVITMSYGGWDDFHDGSSSPALAADYAWAQGAVVLFSAGNDADDDEHFSGTVAAGSQSPFIQIDVTDVLISGTVALGFNLVWFDGTGTSNDLEIQIYNAAQTPISTATLGQSQSSRGTEQQYFYHDSFLPTGSSTWYVKVINNSGSSQFYNLYLTNGFSSIGGQYARFNAPDPDYTLASPANSDSAIAVGAHVTRVSWANYQGAGYLFPGNTLNDITSFSSHGPTARGDQKPLITGPGSAIISLRDDDVNPIPNMNYDALVIDNDGLNQNGSGPADYIISQGTSMSCPLVAGAVALMKQANPSMSPAIARHLIRGLAATDAFTGAVPNNTWGYGKMDVGAILPYLSVESVQFAYVLEGDDVVLRWSTSAERGVSGFEILRSAAGSPEFVRINEQLIPSRAGDGGSATYIYRDRTAERGHVYYYKIVEVETGGRTREHGPYTVALELPYTLDQNKPNPFNPKTTISFSLPREERVTLAVFDAAGRRVKTLHDKVEGAGVHRVIWDGTDEAGRPVASGVYFYRMDAGKFSQTKKMLLVK